jgi:hypothetical protein
MTHYLLSVHTNDEPSEPMTDEEMHRSHEQIGELEAEMKASEALVLSGRLHGPEAATVVRVADGDVITTDGPFLDAKEHIGGFYIIEADDLDAALGWASKTSAAIKMPIEVRPFFGIADPRST